MEAERRQVTIVFTDMAGFTTFSERSGEEAAFRLMQDVARLTGEAVRREGGVVQGFTGDGVLAVFGAPKAFEDAPLRACRAALGILDSIDREASIFETAFGIRPQLRIGVNTGPAVLGQVQGDAGGVTAMGDTVNVAARLQTVAAPGTIFLTEATQKLVGAQIDSEFVGERQFKGKAEPLKLYKLTGLRRDTTRFAALAARGLSPYVGRARELEVLERNLRASRQRLLAVDIVADPGMGKSRLVHEFRHKLNRDNISILSGNCSPDGKQTAFLPFIEVVRGSFSLSVGEVESEVVRKLEAGLSRLQRYSAENLGLLLNLLGLPPPVGALDGLDGLLIGLRTRDLLLAMLEARSRLSPLALLIEDLHWIDSASEELLSKIIGLETEAPILVLLTHRPEYKPPWSSQSSFSTLALEPLEAAAVHRLVEGRLDVSRLPDTLARTIEERAEGNPLFAEEIVSFLTERGFLKVAADTLEFDPRAISQSLPSSVQSLLTARVDQLAPGRRALLQAASVIGRRFDPELLSVVIRDNDDTRGVLAEMESRDLVRPVAGGSAYEFKHALVRDALYESLLSTKRMDLHLKVAEEIERCSGNRLVEVAEELAHHYGQTDQAEKEFFFLAMAGEKSLGVYSLDEAERHFSAAIKLLDKKQNCATDQQVIDLLANCSLCWNLSMQLSRLTETVARFVPKLLHLGDSHQRVLIYHHYVVGLIESGRFREAERAQSDLNQMAVRVQDRRSMAYATTSGIWVSIILDPSPVGEFERQSQQVIDLATNINDPYIRFFSRFVIAWDGVHRGRIAEAKKWADELISLGQSMNDPRSLGFGRQLHAWIALLGDNYPEALDFAERAWTVARVGFDRESIKNIDNIVPVLMRRPGAHDKLRDWRQQCQENNWGYYLTALDPIWGVSLVIRGDIGEGIQWMKKTIIKREEDGYLIGADWSRLFLCEIYLEIISGKDKPPASVLARNAPTLLAVAFTAKRAIVSLVERVRSNPGLDPNGHFVGRCEMIIGLLYKSKKKPALAVQHLTEAKRIAQQFGETPMLSRINDALTDLSAMA